jgi:hypothetical protein
MLLCVCMYGNGTITMVLFCWRCQSNGTAIDDTPESVSASLPLSLIIKAYADVLL